SQQPGWVNSGNAETAVQAWMKAFCDRYPDTKLIDVVKEPPPHTTPGYIGGMGGTGTSGYDWIVNAFKWARAACPNAILILNDYNNIEYGNDNAHTIDIVNKIKAAGAPIDAIGAQARVGPERLQHVSVRTGRLRLGAIDRPCKRRDHEY